MKNEYAQNLTQMLAEVMEVDVKDVSPTQNFGEQGMDSLTGMRFARKISDLTGCEIELEWLFDYPSIEELSAFLVKQFAGKPLLAEGMA